MVADFAHDFRRENPVIQKKTSGDDKSDIMTLYTGAEKQMFIAFDKQACYLKGAKTVPDQGLRHDVGQSRTSLQHGNMSGRAQHPLFASSAVWCRETKIVRKAYAAGG